MTIPVDEVFENVVEYESDDADSSATSNFVDEGDIPTNSTPNQLNSMSSNSVNVLRAATSVTRAIPNKARESFVVKMTF